MIVPKVLDEYLHLLTAIPFSLPLPNLVLDLQGSSTFRSPFRLHGTGRSLIRQDCRVLTQEVGRVLIARAPRVETWVRSLSGDGPVTGTCCNDGMVSINDGKVRHDGTERTADHVVNRENDGKTS